MNFALTRAAANFFNNWRCADVPYPFCRKGAVDGLVFKSMRSAGLIRRPDDGSHFERT